MSSQASLSRRALLAIAAAALGPRAARGPARGGPADLVRPLAGVALPMHHRDPRRRYDRELREIRALGADWVLLVVATEQLDAEASHVPRTSPRTPPDERVAATVRRARELGLEVLLMPVVLLARAGPDDWRGSLRPANPDAWWASYGELVGGLAEVGRAEGAAALAVGSELASLEREEARWRALVAATRARFPGRLTYSANWDHFDAIRFWDALDFAGMTAYFRLSPEPDPTVADLARGWRRALGEARRLGARSHLPVVLTEVGVPSLRGGAAAPWDYTRDAPADPDLQRRAFEAFAEVFLPDGHPVPSLGGLFLYDWWGRGGPDDRTYTARGKPAEEVWRRLLGQLRAADRGGTAPGAR